MKKIFTLLAGFIFSVAVFAAGVGPELTIHSSKNYKILVDGRTYFSRGSVTRINNLSPGVHKIEVYEMRRGVNSPRETMVSSTSFTMGNRDVRVFIDHDGRINIKKERPTPGNNRDNRDWDNDRTRDRDNRDWDNDRSRDRDERGWDNRSRDRDKRDVDNDGYKKNKHYKDHNKSKDKSHKKSKKHGCSDDEDCCKDDKPFGTNRRIERRF